MLQVRIVSVPRLTKAEESCRSSVAKLDPEVLLHVELDIPAGARTVLPVLSLPVTVMQADRDQVIALVPDRFGYSVDTL